MINNLGSEYLNTLSISMFLSFFGDTHIKRQNSCKFFLDLCLIFYCKDFCSFQNILLMNWTNRNIGNGNLRRQ